MSQYRKSSIDYQRDPIKNDNSLDIMRQAQNRSELGMLMKPSNQEKHSIENFKGDVVLPDSLTYQGSLRKNRNLFQ